MGRLTNRFDVSKWEVREAYREVKKHQGAPGVNGQSQVTARRVQSLREWQGFSHRLDEAGHQPYCLVSP